MDFAASFTNARRVGTPLIKVNTPDANSTIANVRKTLGGKTKENATPLVCWDAISGLRGLNDKGVDVIKTLLANKEIASDATVQLPITLHVLDQVAEDLIVFVHNIHLFWADALVIQGVWNLRDKYKANGMLFVMMASLGTVLPAELNSDVLSLEDPLPNRQEIRKIVKDMFGYANVKEPSEKVYEAAGDALVGIASFPAEQAVAMELDKASGTLNVKGLWSRKRDIVKATPGLSFFTGDLTFADMGGGVNIKKYGGAIMEGKRGANVILRVDEIEKAFAGAGTDTSGVKGDLLGNFLSWVEDKQIFCILLLGVPGASKSHFIYCLGGQYEKPVINFDIAGMQDSLVGNSGKNLRNAEATVEAISDGQIMLVATANSLRGLPAELLSRFEKGGIFFFDTPDADERAAIMDLKIKKYKLTSDQIKTIPNTDGWTGREIESLCDKADRTGITLMEAAEYVIPLSVSQRSTIVELRESAHDKYLSASKAGRYKYTEQVNTTRTEITHEPVVTTGRKMR